MVSNTGSATHTSEVTVPPQRVQQSEAVRETAAGLAAVERATSRLDDIVERMDDADARGASALPAWTRGHVLTHLARNADGLVNLLTWARTGVEHPMYASRADRDNDIEEGAPRSLWLLHQDLVAACSRFAAATTGMSELSWQTDVVAGNGLTYRAYQLPWLRVTELWVHMVDLDLGITFDDVPWDIAEHMIGDVRRHYGRHPETPRVRLTVDLAGGRTRTWEFGSAGESHEARGSTSGALAWLTGRGADGVSGDVPELPGWL
jgi:maleylpyruvate isomerase